MRILLFSKSFSPEPSGIGPYSAGLAEWLAARGHDVHVICATPSYPYWKRFPGYGGWWWNTCTENGVVVHRCPAYVPERVNGTTRLAHYASFGIAAAVPALFATLRCRPDIVLHVAPTMLTAPVALVAARAAKALSWVHVQDFEVGAARGTGMLKADSYLTRAASKFEDGCIRRFDMASSISPAMCQTLATVRGDSDNVYEFRNWADLEGISPQDTSSYRDEWGIDRPYVALYSGSIAKKQGIGLLIDAARALVHRRDLQFVICGDGPDRPELELEAVDLDNIQFHDLQPRERLNELLALATVHLLPQKAGVADQVLPSKLTNMLASGRPTIATAAPGTGLYTEVEGCGLLTPPGEAGLFAAAISDLIDRSHDRARFSAMARQRARERWGQQDILERLEARLISASSTARTSKS